MSVYDRSQRILEQNPSLNTHTQGRSIANALALQIDYREKLSCTDVREDLHTAIRGYVEKQSSGSGMPAIPTPQFPAGLQKLTPKTVKSGPANPKQGQTSTTYSQVHTQPPAVNNAPFQGVKSVAPPPVR